MYYKSVTTAHFSLVQILNKVVTVFSALCGEVLEMKQKVCVCVCVCICVRVYNYVVHLCVLFLCTFVHLQINCVCSLPPLPSCTAAGCHKVLPSTATV